uniref:Uncharacterized protein n=1 Tax=Anguilla anguilla TaxID=7936 RepID=A0A0E9UHR3_ANGAN
MGCGVRVLPPPT